MVRAASLDKVEGALGHRFADRTLLEHALTHSSMDPGNSSERLEFLGDRVLGLVVAQMLLERFPDEPEGAIGRRFAALVRADTLAGVGNGLGVADHVRAGPGVVNDSIVADVVEALIAAMFLDGGIAVAEAFIRKHWEELVAGDPNPPRDPKTALQEWVQARALGLPVYDEVGRSGPDHAPVFTVEVRVEGAEPVRASGTNKRAAEREAAAIMLGMLGVDSDG